VTKKAIPALRWNLPHQRFLWYKYQALISMMVKGAVFAMSSTEQFRIGFSGDFQDERGQLIFPDIGLHLLDGDVRLTHEFIAEYRPIYHSDQLAQYDVVISLKPRVTAESLQQVERLTAIGRFGVGYDSIDLSACTRADVAVYITPEAVRRPMAESIVVFILALSHNLVLKDRWVRQGRWAESTRRLGIEPRDRVLGTIGIGGIPSEALRLLRPFGFARVLAFDPYIDAAKFEAMEVKRTTLDDLLRQSDFVLINCPLTGETRHLIGERELGLMRPNAFLINTARGSIVDESALIRALEKGAIRGAALDVFETEPLDVNSPLLRMENVILTSHSVGWTEELFRDMGKICCGGALAVYRGEAPPNVVNREVLDRPGFRAKLDRYRRAAQKSAAHER
jgi:phosphoglycerate dehydrogenase-like enzyme